MMRVDMKIPGLLPILTFMLVVPLAERAAASEGAELIMRAYGNISVAPTVQWGRSSSKAFPGYRSEFMTYVDFFKAHGVIFNALLGTTSIISDSDSIGMHLDRIKYTLTPGFRIDRGKWLIRGALHHECIHTIGRREENGSIWFNSLQIGVGTKQAYYQYLTEEYNDKNNVFLNTFDARIDAGYVIPARNTLLTGQNHEYVYEQYSLMRYHIGVYRNLACFASLRHNLWTKNDGSVEQQVQLTLNLFRKGTKSFAGLFYTYTFFDNYSLDNSEKLGYLGLRVVY